MIEIDIEEALRTPGSIKLSDLIADAEIVTLDTVKESFFLNVMSLYIIETAEDSPGISIGSVFFTDDTNFLKGFRFSLE